MNLNSHIVPTKISRRRRKDGVALVITLLLLSVITFLAIAFLAMSRRNQSAVSASLDVTTARAMSETAQARAQAEILAQIMASGDPLNYDYMVSRNAINPAGFNNAERAVLDVNNVNYDYLMNTQTRMTNSGTEQVAWVQNIANLFYDPRPPVFVVTNPAYPNNLDFRFYVDINRNGRFETNGYQSNLVNLATGPGTESIDVVSGGVLNGEPEFIGVLKNPLQHHSSINQFIGRYAYLVLPIGKTLDLNYIHNFLKSTYANLGNPNLNNTSRPGINENDGFARDQGIGSWELNLAGVLDAVSPWAYESNNITYGPYGYTYGPYYYLPPTTSSYNALENRGNAFDDAEAILHYRYLPPYFPSGLTSLRREFPTNYPDFTNSYMDMYCTLAPAEAPFDYNGANNPNSAKVFNEPWPGSYQTNLFFDPQDLFDPTKTSANFTNRMILASQRTNTFDRYTFQRLLSCIGMGSSPEYGVWVYGDNGQLTLRTKVNINYDNTAQITNAYAPLRRNANQSDSVEARSFLHQRRGIASAVASIRLFKLL
jgi:Tfp pilus assembly protein PilX